MNLMEVSGSNWIFPDDGLGYMICKESERVSDPRITDVVSGISKVSVFENGHIKYSEFCLIL